MERFYIQLGQDVVVERNVNFASLKILYKMALIRFFKTPKHKRYEYIPRYWEPEKEELHDRIRKLEEAKNSGIEGMRDRVQMGLRRTHTRDNSVRKRETMRSNITLLIVIIVLLAITYAFLTQYLPRIIQAMEGNQGL